MRKQGKTMTRALLLTLGWLGATGLFYVSLVALELYWNVFNWSFRLDGISIALVLSGLGGLAGLWKLAGSSQATLTRAVALLCCLFLAVLAVYIFPAEPEQPEGLLPRTAPSPLWYRTARSVLLCLPALFWARANLNRYKVELLNGQTDEERR
jgi:hypothetical protein